MKSWRVIQAGIVTPKGDPSTLDAPAMLMEHFTQFAATSALLNLPFDRSASLEQAAVALIFSSRVS